MKKKILFWIYSKAKKFVHWYEKPPEEISFILPSLSFTFLCSKPIKTGQLVAYSSRSGKVFPTNKKSRLHVGIALSSTTETQKEVTVLLKGAVSTTLPDKTIYVYP
jgi:hypothetical protein